MLIGKRHITSYVGGKGKLLCNSKCEQYNLLTLLLELGI